MLSINGEKPGDMSLRRINEYDNSQGSAEQEGEVAEGEDVYKNYDDVELQREFRRTVCVYLAYYSVSNRATECRMV